MWDVETICLFFFFSDFFFFFLDRFSAQISQYSVRAQIVAYYFSLSSLLDDVPSVRQSHFMIGRAGEPKVSLDSGADLCPDPRYTQLESNASLTRRTEEYFTAHICFRALCLRFKGWEGAFKETWWFRLSVQVFLPNRTFQRRPQQLLSADGKTLLNLWFIPHFSQVLHMFKTLSVSVSTCRCVHFKSLNFLSLCQ